MLLALIFFVAHSNLKNLNRYHPMYSKNNGFLLRKILVFAMLELTRILMNLTCLSTKDKKIIIP